jgi:hypothetical protein
MRPCPLFAALLLTSPLLAAGPAWEPEKTWVFAVGILRFAGKTTNDWPEAGRKDEVMLATLKERGVPAEQIVFLKNEQATLGQLRKRLAEFVSRPGKDDTLIFYYAGHGGRDYSEPARPVHLVPYDRDRWPTAEVLDTIEAGFKGSRVLLTADCCHSGGLAEEAAKRRGDNSYGTLTSARSSATSTGSWAFTESLIDVYRGAASADLDHDGAITFAEAGQYADLKMAFRENQRATTAVAAEFPRAFTFAKVKGPVAQRVLVGCDGRDKGKWYKAEVLSARDGKYFVTWPGWDRSHDSWLAAADLRPTDRNGYADGTRVEIQWGKKWYPGKVVRTELGLLLVHYDGYTAADDEWVPVTRLRVPGAQ